LSRGARRLRGILTETRARLPSNDTPTGPVHTPPERGPFGSVLSIARPALKASRSPSSREAAGLRRPFFIFEYGTMTPPPSFAGGGYCAGAYCPHRGAPIRPAQSPLPCAGLFASTHVFSLFSPSNIRTAPEPERQLALAMWSRCRSANVSTRPPSKILLKRAVQQPSGFSRTSVTHPRPWRGRRRFVDLSRARRCGR
jgi:hypothetical protein